jgi:hypothetical protein
VTPAATWRAKLLIKPAAPGRAGSEHDEWTSPHESISARQISGGTRRLTASPSRPLRTGPSSLTVSFSRRRQAVALRRIYVSLVLEDGDRYLHLGLSRPFIQTANDAAVRSNLVMAFHNDGYRCHFPILIGFSSPQLTSAR